MISRCNVLSLPMRSYASRVRSIINEATKNTASKEMLRLKKQIAYWKQQAGKPCEEEDLEDIQDERPARDP